MPIVKNKGDVQMNLMSHTIKIWERVAEAKLRERGDDFCAVVWFLARKSTINTILALGKCTEGHKELYFVLVELQKAYERVLREDL